MKNSINYVTKYQIKLFKTFLRTFKLEFLTEIYFNEKYCL